MTNDEQRFERANRLKLIIESLNMTGRTFAKSLEMSQGAISNIANGKRAITIEFVDMMSERHTSINPIWLLFGTGTMFKEQEQPRSVEEPRVPYEKPRPIALEDLAAIIISIQDENAELRARLERVERRLDDQDKKRLP